MRVCFLRKGSSKLSKTVLTCIFLRVILSVCAISCVFSPGSSSSNRLLKNPEFVQVAQKSSRCEALRGTV